MDSRPISEQIVRFGDGRTGILTLPQVRDDRRSLPGVVYLNAVPDRISVDYCRYLAGQGMACLRFDLSGTVDSLLGEDPRPILEVWIDEAISALDYLEAGQQIDRCVLMGVCKGARVAAEAATMDPRVVGVIPINLDCPASVVGREGRIRYLTSPRWWALFGAARVPGKLRALLQGKRAQANALGNFHSRVGDFFGSDEAEVVAVWQRVVQQRVSVLAVFSEFDYFYDFFRLKVAPAIGNCAGPARLQLELARNADHNLTAVSVRQQLRRGICNWLLREFGDEETGSRSAPVALPAGTRQSGESS